MNNMSFFSLLEPTSHKTCSNNWLCLYVLCSILLFPLKTNADIENLRLNQLSPNEGLSQGTVNHLLLDKDGLLWLATEGGLNFYDGYEVKRLMGPDNIFNDASISYLYQDSTGIIWISTLYSGLYSLDPKTLDYKKILDTNIAANPDDVKEVLTMVEGAESNFWLAVTDELQLLDSKSGQVEILFRLKDLVTEDHIIRRLLIHDGFIYIATSAGLYVMDIATKHWKALPYLSIDKPNADQVNTKELYLDLQGTL